MDASTDTSSGGSEKLHADALLSVIIPAWNEAGRLTPTLESIRGYAGRSGRRCEVLVVDDGSSDGTADVVRAFEPGPLTLRLLVNPHNMGKGDSVRRGVLQAAGDSLLISDADLSAPIEQVAKLLGWLARGYDVAIGSRAMPDSRVSPPRSLKRRLMAAGFHLIRRCVLPGALGRLRDTQCGFKCFTRRAARDVFALAETNGFAFDCEVLALARRLGYRITEVGVAWSAGAESRFRPVRGSLGMLADLVRIRRRVSRVHPRQR